jgi:hypothetical protein
VIVETITCLILHCHRCNKPFRDDSDDEYGGVYHWETREGIAKEFNNRFGEYGGWRRFGDRYICGNCQISNGYADDLNAREVPEPLPPLESDKVTRAQAEYAAAERHVIDLNENGWTIKHPLSCRPNLLDCPISTAADRDLTSPPAEWGRYVCELDSDGSFVVGPRVEAREEAHTDG